MLVLKNGVVVEIIPAANAGDDIIFLEGILCPGFVNAHCHTELSHLKNKIPKHTGLINFVQEVLKLRNEEIYTELITSTLKEIRNSGTVAVGDICNTKNSIAAKLQSDIHFTNFIEVSGFIDDHATSKIAAIQDVEKYFHEKGLNATIVPHAPYSVSPALFRLIGETSAGKLITIHNQECEAENLFFESGTGEMFELYTNLGIDISFFRPSFKTSLQTWLPYFLQQPVIAVHNTFITTADVHAAKNVSFCICIRANLHIENTLPPVQLLMDEKAHIVLGTDSLASNDSLNMYDEIKTIKKYFPEIPLETILQWATSNGAKTLQLDDTYGSFKKGNKPGVVQIHNDNSQRII